MIALRWPLATKRPERWGARASKSGEMMRLHRFSDSMSSLSKAGGVLCLTCRPRSFIFRALPPLDLKFFFPSVEVSVS
jgi:hypothetical protein